MTPNGDRPQDNGPVSIGADNPDDERGAGHEKSQEKPANEAIESKQSTETVKTDDNQKKSEKPSSVLSIQNITNPTPTNAENPKPSETTKKTVMTLSVANLMSDPTPLNALHNKAPTVTIKANQPVSVQRIPVRTIPARNLTTLPTIPRAAMDFANFPPAPLPIIQAQKRPAIDIPHTTFNPNYPQYAYTSYYAQYNPQYPKIANQFQPSYPIPQYQQPQTYTPQRQALPQPVINIPPQPNPPKSHNHDMQPPEPTYYTDEDSSQYGVRCTCGDNHNRGFLVQCDKCQFWLHGVCVNCPRASSREQFYCPFCMEKRLRCRCKKNKSYNMPIVQCSHCKLYVHKQCEGLGFGIIPKPFVCCQCHKSPFELPFVKFDPNFKEIKDFTVYVDPSRYEVIINVPEGAFKNSLEQDLTKSEVSFFDIISKYFNKFVAHLLGNQPQEIWRVFTSTFAQIFNVGQDVICSALDHLIYQLLYAKEYVPYTDVVPDFAYSEVISEYVEGFQGKSYDKPPLNTSLSVNSNMKVISPVAFNDGDYICDLPGFLMHTDEVFSDNGIPPTCLAVDGTDLVIDMSGSKFNLATHFRRSMHPNAAVRLIQVSGKPRVALFATKVTGPCADDKSSTPIQAGGEIILPFDGDLPFHVDRKPWKDKKQRQRPQSKSKEEKANQKKKKSQAQQPKKATESFPPLTLLSCFLEDIIPPIPVQLVSDEEMADRMKNLDKVKDRRVGRAQNEDYVFE